MSSLIEQAQQELSEGRQLLASGDARRAQQHALAVQGDLIDTVVNSGTAASERAAAKTLYAQAGDLATQATNQIPSSTSRRRAIRSLLAAAATPVGGTQADSTTPSAVPTAGPVPSLATQTGYGL